MSGALLALVWFGVISLALGGLALAERRGRLASPTERPELMPPRRDWGFERDAPPGAYTIPRILAAFARMVRSRSVLTDQAVGLRVLGRFVSFVAIASALALVPFANPFGASTDGLAIVVFDFEFGMLALIVFVFLAGLSQVGLGLAHRSLWSRFGSVRIASRMLGGTGLLLLVLTPLIIEAQSLRLADLVAIQQGTFRPLAWLAGTSLPSLPAWATDWTLPGWHLLTQPVTAILFVPAMSFLVRRPSPDDPVAGPVAVSGFGFDGDPADAYWGRVESRLSLILFAALFVALFLGGGSLPYLDHTALLTRLGDFAGEVVPAVAVAGVELMIFVAKLILVLALLFSARRATTRLREDQWLRIVTRRLLPAAWANLLLVSAIRLVSDSLERGGA